VRRWTVGAALLVAALSAGCASEPEPAAPPAEPTPVADEPAVVNDKPLRDAFSAANKGAAWFGSVDRVQLDGRAVIVWTTLVEEDATAREVCEAAYAAAGKSRVDFQSVAVRSADDSTLAHRNELAGDVACQ
jgi:hypothetical protein